MARKRSNQRADLVRQAGAGADRSLLEEAVGDLGDRAAADGADAGDRQQIGHQRARRLRIGTGQRREHALIFRPLLGGAQRQALQIVRQVGLAVEVLHQSTLPDRRKFERGDQRGIKPDIAGLRMSGAVTP